MRVISKASAKRRGLKRFYTGQPCEHGHTVERYVSTGACVDCDRQRCLAYAKEHPEKFAAATRRWRKNNPERAREQTRRAVIRWSLRQVLETA